MDVPAKNNPQNKPKTPTAGKRPVKKRSAAEERESAALAKIAKNFRRVHVPRQQRGPQFLFVLLAFLSLFFFFDFVDELPALGKPSVLQSDLVYEVPHALLYVTLLMPSRVYELLPIPMGFNTFSYIQTS